MKVLTGKDIMMQRTVFHVCLQFQPRDMWFGVYVKCWWQRDSILPDLFESYVCLIPCFPVHIRLIRYSRSVTL